MLSKANIDVPYISKGLFSTASEWVAIPVSISVKRKEFLAASQKSKELIVEVFGAIDKIISAKYPTHLLEFDQEFEDLKPAIQLAKLGDNESQANVGSYIIIRFPEKGEFWEKIEYLGNVLDYLYKHAQNYKSDKFQSIQFGERFIFSK